MKKASKGDSLSLRLRMLADLVSEGSCVADVGCDHGFLPVELVSSGKCPGALAMDVRPGPLSRAEEHIREAGLTEQISTRLGDGLKAMKAEEADSVVIAGMGGPLMEKILADSIETCRSMKELILQPQSDIPHFRKFLLENGFQITDEKIIKDSGKFYIAMKAVPDRHSSGQSREQRKWTDSELSFGRFLSRKKDPVMKEYLLREKRLHEGILSSLEGKETENTRTRSSEIKRELQMIKEELKIYESL